ncbi:MAG: HAD family hydrolase [Cyanobium sp. Prado107]|jgi:hydroxymethylpyrimidine pyrophosphatase-like HAD family hydrolase|nr:HAD family hydrolase [Cyanobium sp. Prado107]
MTSGEAPMRRRVLERRLAGGLPRAPELVLVTDLDGTLLGGETDERLSFYSWLRRERQRVLHVFCTGRSLNSIKGLLREQRPMGLQAPHLVISDVGCTVACGTSLQPLPEMLVPIEALWRGKRRKLAPLLKDVPGLSPQPVSTDRRLGYTYQPERFDPALIPRLERHGVDCLLSGERYFDVLPAGVNKGSTLRLLLEWIGIDDGRVVTAGDSLNDLAMFETGLAGIMVANAEAALRSLLPRLPRTYGARAQGCAGIVEGLHHFGFGHLFD